MLLRRLVAVAVLLVTLGCAPRAPKPLYYYRMTLTPGAARATTRPTQSAVHAQTAGASLGQPTTRSQAAITPLPTPLPKTPTPVAHVVGSYPLDGDTAVQPSRALIIDFDRPMDPQSVAAHLTFSPPIAGQITWPTPQRLVFSPTLPWAGATYDLYLAAEATDVQGWPLAEALHLVFGCGGHGVPVPIFMYHHFAVLAGNASKVRRGLTVSPEAFAAQMTYLVEHGWRSISPTQLAGYLIDGNPLPPRPVMITIDDGYEEIYKTAYPVFLRTGIRPVLFIVPKYVDTSPYVTWAELQEMVNAGFAVGAHGFDHSDLRKANAAGLQHQFGDTQASITKHLGITVDAFCYPYGSYNKNVVASLDTYHYATGFTSNEGVYQSPLDPYRLARVWVGYDATLQEFIERLP